MIATEYIELPKEPRQPSRAAQRVAEAVAHHLHLETRDLFGRDRHKSFALARQVVMFVLREHQRPRPSFPEIARDFGRDHTTVMSAMKTIVRLAAEDEYVRDAIEIGRAALAGEAQESKLSRLRRCAAIRDEIESLEQRLREAGE